jgi:hypothetical protein
MRCDADTPEVEAIGVPASLDRHVGVRPLVGMPGAGPMQEEERAVGQVEQPAPERPGELGGSGSVVGIGGLVDPSGVVEDAEPPDHLDVRSGLLGESKPILQHPRPVGDPVFAAPGEGVLIEDGLKDEGDVHPQDGSTESAKARTIHPRS